MKYFALALLISVNIILASAASSYCNKGTCDTIADCALGLCCNNTCVESPSVLPSGADCDATNYCSACPSGQSCQSGKCTDVKCPATRSNGCDCTESTDCSSQLCLSGKCAAAGLNAGDICTNGTQCVSTKCDNGVCGGAAEGEDCLNSLYCNAGLSCIGQKCVVGPMIGEACNVTSRCGQYNANCVDGVCIDSYSVAVNGNCTFTSDCAPGLVCQKASPLDAQGACVAVTACNQTSPAAACSPFEKCQCDGENPMCKTTVNHCPTQMTALNTCMRANNCTASAVMDSSRCGYVHCMAETLALSCCQNCGGDSNNMALAGLDCSAATPVYTPFSYCGTGSCTATAGKCASSTTTGSNTTAGTTGDNGSNAVAMFASFALIALMLIISA